MSNIIDMKRRNLSNAERRRQQFATCGDKFGSNGDAGNNVNHIQVKQHNCTNGQVFNTSNF